MRYPRLYKPAAHSYQCVKTIIQMKKVLKFVAYLLGGLLLILVLAFAFLYVKSKLVNAQNMALVGKEAPTITVAGHSFRDLNKNGKSLPTKSF
jgi:hypothetical protein